MAQLYFNYGAMGSSKTANALIVAFNYREKGQKALLVKPRIDNRESDKVIRSRIGLEHSCIYFDEFIEYTDTMLKQYNCIIVDEAQFLGRVDVEYLANYIVDTLDIPVMCYGLRSDFRGELFTGSEALLALADKITEIKTVCWCGRKAVMNTRFQDGKVIKTGEQIVIGANEKYTALCRKHWAEGNLGPQKLD